MEYIYYVVLSAKRRKYDGMITVTGVISVTKRIATYEDVQKIRNWFIEQRNLDPDNTVVLSWKFLRIERADKPL